jgi:hypothetical protein
MSFARSRPRGFGVVADRPGALGRPRAARRTDRRRRPGLRLALTVWWHGTELDRRLAAGEDPRSSDELSLRAKRLIATRSRGRVAKGLAGALRSAKNDGPRFTAAVRPRSADVLDADGVITAIERRLRGPGPVGARGVALVRLLLIDGNGPLYQPGEAGALATRLRAAATALRAPVAGD